MPSKTRFTVTQEFLRQTCQTFPKQSRFVHAAVTPFATLMNNLASEVSTSRRQNNYGCQLTVHSNYCHDGCLYAVAD
jgi:hypothetical protein